MNAHLAERLRCAADAPPAWSAESEQAIETTLRQALQQARSSWPAISLSDHRFVEHVGRHFPFEGEPVSTLQGLRLDELFLCRACAAGERAALDVLEADYLRVVDATVARLRIGDEQKRDAKQQLRVDLLVGDRDREPRILDFAGRGTLRGWLKVVTTRRALRANKRAARDVPTDAEMLERVSPTDDEPELEQIKQAYAGKMKEAITRAFASLDADQRNLLRLYVADGLTLEQLGRMNGVDTSTVSRWLARIRRTLFERARDNLTKQLQMRASEYDSLARVLQSRIHVSVERLLLGDADA